MSETLLGFEEVPRNENESRFGDKDAIISILNNGEPISLNEIENTPYAELISSHSNIIELAEIANPENNNHINSLSPILFSLNEQSVFGIFKPFEGENKKVKSDTAISKFYTQELAAYMISEHFNLDLVPPTTIRTINGQIGSLQLFVNPNKYISHEIFEENINKKEEKLSVSHEVISEEKDNAWEKVIHTEDFQKMALFDFLLANMDRRYSNYLIKVKKDKDGFYHCNIDENDKKQPALIAIDHGLSLSFQDYKHYDLKGPTLYLTQKPDPTGTRVDMLERKIPEDLLDLLRDGLAKRNDFNYTSMIEGIEKNQVQEISYMWQRAKALIETGVFLTKYNIKKHCDKEKNSLPAKVLEQPYPHPAF